METQVIIGLKIIIGGNLIAISGIVSFIKFISYTRLIILRAWDLIVNVYGMILLLIIHLTSSTITSRPSLAESSMALQN
jgi:hypothetical protein